MKDWLRWNFSDDPDRKAEYLKKHYGDENYKPNPGRNSNTGFGIPLKEVEENFKYSNSLFEKLFFGLILVFGRI